MAHSHGHTPAAWTGSIIAFVGFCVASYFTVVAQPVGVAAGVVLTLAGAVVGGLMRAAGLGQKNSKGMTAEQFQAHKQAHKQAHQQAHAKAHS
jgi:hypothetical protein